MNKNKTDRLLEKIGNRLDGIESRLEGIDTRVSGIEKNMTRLDTIEKNMATKKDLKKLENKIIKKLNFVVDHFDGENMGIKQRLDKVEKRVDLFTSV